MRFTIAVSLLCAAEAFAPLSGTTVHPAFTRSGSAIATSNLENTRGSNARPLFGILDEMESDAYDLTSTAEETDVNMNDAFEMFLADLVFSTNNPKMDIINNFDRAGDPVFVEWLDKKIENSKDPEERLALRDLFDMIEDVQRQLEVNKLKKQREAEEGEQAATQAAAEGADIEEGDADGARPLTSREVLEKASAIDTAGAGDVKAIQDEKKKVSFYDQQLTPEIRLSYEGLLKKVLPPYKAGESPSSVAFNYYDQFDAQFVKVLDERAQNGDADSKNLMEAIASEQQSRLAAATAALQEVLAMGSPPRMEGAIIQMAREGRVDEAFLLLLEANETQAKDAGALGPAQLMQRLRHRAMEEKDKQASSKEIALIRKLLRTEESADREAILEDAFTPRETLLVRSSSCMGVAVVYLCYLVFLLFFRCSCSSGCATISSCALFGFCCQHA